jgi:toxin ParE1/3/4
MKPVVLAPAAQAELEGATEWYEVRAGGIGLKFVLCVDEALQEIGESPASFPKWEQDDRVRRFVLQRFPYVIFYRETPEAVEVIAVAHGAREPGYWRKRT